MKNLKEIQAQYDLLKAEQDGLRQRLAEIRKGVPFLFTFDTLYQAEKQLSMLSAQLGVLSWVAA